MQLSFVRWRAPLAGSLLLGLLGAYAPALAAPEEKSPESRLQGVVNINTATTEQLELLPSVGAARARAIIAYRTEHNGFKTVDELENVAGIGDAALELMRPHCVTQGQTTAKAAP